MNKYMLSFMDEEDRLLYLSLRKPTPDLIIPNLYLGNINHAKDLETLTSLDIKAIVQISDEEIAPRYPECFQYYTVTFKDLETIDISKYLFSIIEFIARMIEKGNVFVHCNAGISRSVSVVIGYLIVYHEMSYDEAHAYVKAKRACIFPNSGFVKFLKALEKQYSKRSSCF